ncbi:MAG: glycosyltransferase [Candidatus Limisoma sp.]
MKTLLQINVVANSGSTGRIAEEIGRLALARGWRSVVAYGRWANESESELIRIGSRAEVMCHGVESLLLDRHGLGSARATRRLIKQIEQIRPDIIHLHNLHGYYINYELLFDYLSHADVPVVWTLHDCWTVTGHCAQFLYLGCDKWTSQCEHCPSIASHDYPASLFVDASARNFRRKRAAFTSVPRLTLVPVCDWLGDILSRSFLSGVARRTIYNGIDLDVFRPHESRAEFDAAHGTAGRFLALAVSTVWSHLKGLDDLRTLARQMPDVAFAVVGLTAKQMRTMPANVVSLARTESAGRLAAAYSAADVFVSPTYYDTLPTVEIEAIACGTPVVSYNMAGCRDIVVDGCGELVATGNVSAFREAIERVLAVGKSAFSDACRRHAEQNFNKAERFRDYMDLYDSILNNEH